MYMIWLATVMNGQQRPIAAIPSVLVLAGEAITSTTSAATARAVATAAIRALAMTAFPLGHFYICRTEC